MKRIISLLLVIALCIGAVCILAACESDEIEIEITDAPTLPDETTPAVPDETVETPDLGEIVGGWEINADAAEADMPEEARAAFDKAMEELDGATHTPIAYLGSQVVAGTNYAYLCKTELVTADPVTKLTLVTVYNDLEGNASILDIVDVNIADYTEDAELDLDASLVGGWSPSADYPAKLNAEDQDAFDSAILGLTGVDYTPLALMGTQVVAGRNLAFLCCAQNVTPDSAAVLAVVVVYAALDGTSTVTSIAPFDIG